MEYEYDVNQDLTANCTSVSEDKDESSNVWPLTLQNVLQGLPSVVGMLANILLLVLFATTPRLRTVSSMFLLQRAIADMLSLVTMFLFIVFRTSDNLPYSQATCTTLSITGHVGFVASLVILMLFTMDSYMASCPQAYTLLFRRKVMLLTSAASWLLATAVGFTAYFLSFEYGQNICVVGPFFSTTFVAINKIIEIFILLVVPLVVVWVFVCLMFPPRLTGPSADPKEKDQECPNRRLLLGLAFSFTALHGLYWLVIIVGILLPSYGGPFSIVLAFAFSLPTVNEALNPILVICLTEGRRQKVAGGLPARHSASVPLQDL